MVPDRSRARLALLQLGVVLLAGLPIQAVASTLPGVDCNVLPGTGLQRAIDAAAAGARVVLCPGVYKERITIAKSIVLEAREGAILDGLELGAGHGITLAPGVSRVTISGLELRNFRGAFRAESASIGIFASGTAREIVLDSLRIHHNGWAGVAALGFAEDWTIRNTTFRDQRNFHVLTENATRWTVEKNTFSGTAEAGIVLFAARETTVAENVVAGTGSAAIAVGPRFHDDAPAREVNVQLNRVTGAWTHGIWGANLRLSSVVGNVVSGPDTAITLGGNPEQVVLAWNSGSPIVETKSTNTFLSRVAPRGLSDIRSYVLDALEFSLNPLVGGEDKNDLARLSGCQGRDDGCLRAAFIDVADPTPPRAWTISVDDPLVGDGELRFVDAAVRRPGAASASRRVVDTLDQEWTTLVLCRFYPASGAPPQPCEALPRLFDYSLAVDWAPTPTSRHVREWALKLPTAGVHASFDRVSSADATLFFQTTGAHSADSGPPLDADLLPREEPEDPTRSVYAGRTVLHCAIVPSSDGLAGGGGAADDCGDPVIVTEASTGNALLWCDARAPWFSDEAHADLVDEAVAGWAWSDTCSPLAARIEAPWADFLSETDLRRLSRAQEDHANAASAAQRRYAAESAQAVFTESIARHLALSIADQGMPTVTDPEVISGVLPAFRPESLPGARSGASAVWTGDAVYVFGGYDGDRYPRYTDEILRYDPSTGSVRAMESRLPVPAQGMSAVWTGSAVFLFGGHTGSTPLSSILRYDPEADVLLSLPLVSLDWARGFTAAAWDPRDLPAVGCPGGCAYVFGGGDVGPGVTPTDRIFRFNPATLLGSDLEGVALPEPRIHATAAFVEDRIVVFGGSRWETSPARTLDDVVLFAPESSAVVRSAARMPEPRREAAAVSDGQAVYVIGGCAPAACPLASVLRYDPARDSIAKLDAALPQPLAAVAAAWTGEAAYLLGGRGCPGSCDSVIRYVPWANRATVEALAAASSGFSAVDLTWNRGGRSNVELARIDVWDATRGWVRAKEPALLGFTPAQVVVNVSFTDLAGIVHRAQAAVLLTTPNLPAPPPPLLFEQEGRTYGNVVAWDPESRDYLSEYAPGSFRAHAPTLVNVTSLAGETLGLGFFDVGFEVPREVDAFAACARQTWTGDATGRTVNLDGGLAVEPAANATCAAFAKLDALNARLFSELLVTLELREGAGFSARYLLLDDPLSNLANVTSGEAKATLAQSLAAAGGSAPEDVRLGHVRLVVTIPATTGSDEKATIVAALLRALRTSVGVFAIEVADVALTRQLVAVLDESVSEYGSVVLATAGTLPDAAAAWPVQDKLMTIHGLAASPLVITIGAGSVRGVDPHSRLGPTPWLTPKPDFVAPGITSVAAVVAALPFVEAVAMRGVRHVDLVRATLAAFAVPVVEDGVPATFWEQGFGALDLSPFLDLGGISTGLALAQAVADATGRDRDAVLADAGAALGSDPGEVAAADPRDVVHGVVPPSAILAAVMTALTVRVSLSTPALPSSLQADFGVVNREHAGYARLDPITLDPALNASAASYRALLEGAAWTDVEAVDEATRLLLDRFRLTASAEHEVDVNVTHYKLEDLLEGDLLYSMFGLLLSDAATNVDGDLDLAAVRAPLAPWLLEPHWLVEDAPQRVSLDVTVDRSCDPVPIQGVAQASNGILRVLRASADLLASATGGAGSDIEIARSSDDILGRSAAPYVASQGGQIACLHDALALLEYLRDRTEALRAAKATPWGSLDEAERWSGSWNRTDMGREIDATATALGFDPRDLAASNSALVLDRVLDLVDRMEALLQQKARLLRVPRIVADEPTGTRLLSTIPERTSASPLGLYVGLARMTTRNVTLYDPLTGAEILRRDVTIPLPSFLWNNPTLDVDLKYRDGTPLADTSITLHDGRPKVFDEVSVDPIVVKGGVKVNLTAARGYEIVRQIEAVEGRLAEVAAARLAVGETLNSTGSPDYPSDPFASTADDALEAYDRALRVALGDLEAQLAIRAPRPAGDVRAQVTQIITSLTSRLDHQGGITDATGATSLLNLFPGSYTVFFPYSYALEADLDNDYAPASPGHGALAGDLETPAFAAHKWARESAAALPSSEEPESRDLSLATGAPCPEESPFCDRLPWFEVYERPEGPFHLFDLSLAGPDVLGVLCVYARDFANATAVHLAYPGCEAPLLDLDDAREAEALLRLADCLTGAAPPALGTDQGDACAAFLAEQSEAAAAAHTDPDARLRAAAYADIADEFAELARQLALLDTAERPVVPWFHSPARLLGEDAGRYGYDEASVLAASRADNPGLDDSTILAAVADVLRDLRADVDVVEPPVRSSFSLTEPGAILSRATDRVTGLDWLHLDAAAGDLGDDDPAAQLSLAASMFVDAADQAEVDEFARRARLLPSLPEAYAEGLRASLAEKAQWMREGWRPRGVASPGGLSLAGVATAPRDPCAGAAVLVALPESYVRCELPLVATMQPALRGAGGVDNVQFATALFEEIRARGANYDDADALLAVRRAAALSATDAKAEWTRKTGGVATEAKDGAPAAGLLLYSTPVPLNEYVQVRLDGEIVLQNTGALLVTTANPLVAAALADGLALAHIPSTTSVAEPRSVGLDASFEIAGTIDAAVEEALAALAGEDPLLRIDPLGFPIGIEESFGHGAELAQACLSCGRGLVTARPDGFYNYSRTHEFKTLGRNVDTLYVAIVYFPSLTDAGTDGVVSPQSFGIRDFSIQTSTYIGIGAEPGALATATPLGYSPRIEDWNMLYAVPDVPLVGLDVAIELDRSRLPVTEADLVASPPRGSFRSGCADTVAPGYPTAGFERDPRGIPGPTGYLFWAGSDACATDEVVALRPRHVVDGGLSYWTTTEPKKRVVDSLQYVANVPAVQEEMTESSLMMRDSVCNLLCDPLRLVSLVTLAERGALPALTAVEHAQGGVSRAFEEAAATAVTLVNVANPVLDLRNATPFLQMSFQPGLQRTPSRDARAGPTAHNYVVVDAERARDLLAASGHLRDAAPERLPLLLRDTSNSSMEAEVFHPASSTIPGQRLVARDGSGYNSVVAAHAYRAGIETTGSPDAAQARLGATVEGLVGLGAAGAGLGVRVHATQTLAARDTDTRSFLEGQRFRVGAAFEVETFSLGGPLASDLPCSAVPLYDYVAPYFRCAGADSVEIESRFASEVGTPCYTAALEFVASAQDWALAGLARYPGSVFYVGDGFPSHVGRAVDGGTPDTEYGPEVARRAQAQARVVAGESKEAADALADLLGCLAVAGVHADVRPQGTVVAFAAGTASAIAQAYAGHLANATQNATLALEAVAPGDFVNGPTASSLAAQLHAVHSPWVTTATLRLPYSALPRAAALSGGELVHAAPGAATRVPIAAGDAPALVALGASIPVRDAAAAWDGRHIYLFGGRGDLGLTDSILRYDPATDSVETLPVGLPYPLADAAAVWTGRDVLLVGGRSTAGPVGGVLAFDPAAGSTSPLLIPLGPIEGASVVWAGRFAYVLGGRDGGGESNRILRIDPAAKTLVDLGPRLPFPVADAAVAWDGATAVLLGGTSGGAALDSIVLFTPRNLTAWRAPQRLPDPLRDASAAWNGRDVLAFGDRSVRFSTTTGRAEPLGAAAEGRGGAATVWTGAMALALGGTARGVLASTERGALAAAEFPLAEGTQHAIFLNASAGLLRASDVWRFSVDTQPPEIGDPLLPRTLETPEARVVLRIAASDATSGLVALAVDELVEGSWIELESAFAGQPPGTREGVAGAYVVELEGLPDGASRRLRVRAADVAGNVALLERTVRVDRALPAVFGQILNDVDHVVGEPNLAITARATDPQGILDVRVILVDLVTGRELILASSQPGGAQDSGPLDATYRGTLGSAYRLDVEATDMAGNRNRTAVDSAAIHVAPSVRLVEPQYRGQQASQSVVRIRAIVTIPGFGELSTPTTIRVRAPSGDLVLQKTGTVRGEISAAWDARAAAPGSYEVTVAARAGIFTVTRTATVNVTAPSSSGILEFREYRATGSLNGTTTSDLWKFRHPSGCSFLTVTVASLNGAPVRIALDNSDPEMAGRVRLTYDKLSAETSTSTSVSWQNAPGGVYALLVDRAGAADSAYAVTHTAQCNKKWTTSPPLPGQTVERS